MANNNEPGNLGILPAQNSFFQETVKTLKEEDFSLGAKELICLKYSNCILVLFYNNNRESSHLIKIWADVAAQVAGPVFAACNLFTEKRVAEAFVELNGLPNHPLYWAKMQQTPFILSYRGGWPQAFYNGVRTVEALGDYSLSLACRADYTEHNQLGYGQQAENREETSIYTKYQNPPRKTSTDFTGTGNVRGYNPTLPNVIEGSAVETAQLNKANAENAQTTSTSTSTPTSTPTPAPVQTEAPTTTASGNAHVDSTSP
jgi:hypothetical protein